MTSTPMGFRFDLIKRQSISYVLYKTNLLNHTQAHELVQVFFRKFALNVENNGFFSYSNNFISYYKIIALSI